MHTQLTHNARNSALPDADFIFGRTPGMQAVRETIEQAASDCAPVLIEGESGTGKELVGRYLHQKWFAGEEPFFKINCSAHPAAMLEAGLIGGEAQNTVQPADQSNQPAVGTLFLDQIDSLEHSLQQCIAQSLLARRGRGGVRASQADTRIICAAGVAAESVSNAGIAEALLGCFAYRIRLLPLRDRREDIPALAEHFLGKFADQFGRPLTHLGSRAMDVLQQRQWPGNIRELENWIARIVIFGVEEVVGLELKRQVAGVDRALRYHHALRSKSRARPSRRTRG